MCTPPNPFDTQDQFVRFHHLDVPKMTLAELDRERIEVLMCLSPPGASVPWFGQRLKRLEEAIGRFRNPQDISPLSPHQDPDDQRQHLTQEDTGRLPFSRSGPPLLDRDLIQRLLTGKSGVHFRALWHGDIRAYLCHRDAASALRRRLMWWCQGDAEQVDRIFRQSGLYQG